MGEIGHPRRFIIGKLEANDSSVVIDRGEPESSGTEKLRPQMIGSSVLPSTFGCH